jgi:hypothetical protein
MSTPAAQATMDEKQEDQLTDELDLAFTPIHKRCLGIAVGAVLGTSVFAITLLHMLRSPEEVYPLVLLQQFFIGYSVSLHGALIGLVWGLWVGFVLGWCFAFLRNLTLSVTAVIFRAKAELAQSRGFLDQL